MLGYKCSKCGAVKFPDGKGCQCGASHNELKIIRIKYEDFNYKEDKDEEDKNNS